MSGKRETLARLLDRSGALDLVMKVRARVPARTLSVLTYHSVGEPGPDYPFDPEVIDATPGQFRAQMRAVAEHCTVVGIDEVCAALRGDPLPPNAVLITFDDGYKTCLEVALPILREFDLRAVFFIATDYVGNRKLYWWDRVHYLVKHSPLPALELDYPERRTIDLGDRAAAIDALIKIIKNEHGLDLAHFLDQLTAASATPWDSTIERSLCDDLIMTWDEVRAMRDAGMDIESHTRTHRVLQTLDNDALRDELAGSRADLAAALGTPPRTVAYPVGRTIAHLPGIRAAVESAGYTAGFSNASGINYMWRKPDPLDIRRIAIDRSQSLAMFRAQLAVPQLGYTSRNHGM